MSRRVVLWALATTVVLVGAAAALFAVLGTEGEFHAGVCFNTGPNTAVHQAEGPREVSGRAIIVDCSASHDAKITRRVQDPLACAEEGAWLKSLAHVYCVALRKEPA